MWGNMMGWGGGAGFGLWHLAWLLLLVVAVVAIVRALGGRRPLDDAERGDRALDILRERYARGEIDKAEFEQRKRDLS